MRELSNHIIIVDKKQVDLKVLFDDEYYFIATIDENQVAEFNLKNTEEDGVHIYMMNVNNGFQRYGIGLRLLKAIVEIYGRDIHQPFEKYKFYDGCMDFPRLDSDSEKFINKAINKYKVLNQYYDFHNDNFRDEFIL